MITKNFDVTLFQPHFYIKVCDISDFINFQWKFNEVTSKKITTKMIRGQKCVTTAKLFDEFSAAFQFPYYFGENWDAFDECINDLEWIQSDAYVVCISNAEELFTLPENDLKIFVNLLASAAREWEEGRDYGATTTPPTPFNVILHCTNVDQEEAVISKFLNLGVSLEKM